MNKKRYDPVRIIDPGEGHLVPLLPTQGFIIVLHGNAEIECNSHFFHNHQTDRSEHSTTFHFNQKFDLTDLANGSRVYLGDISILTENKFGSLCVFLESSTVPSFYITVINPNMNIIKIDPSILIKIVIFDNRFSGDWDLTIISGDSGITYQQHDYRKYNADVWRWTTLLNDQSGYEHHYSFKCNTAGLHLDRGTHAAGKIIFDTEEFDGIFKVLNLNVKVKDQNKQKSAISNSLMFPKGVNHNGKIRRYTPQPRDSIYRQEIIFKKKNCSDLHSNRVLYF